ncbi:MFS transporter [Kocuria varians]|uniref:Putative proline/betaine transporter n=1 Tax=Kocuria varians TaxID=1272 RepID=A0A4Y4D5T8_KOCVA|nr:MFS transporter [Kocuria varians]GEC98657.1 MFS transporter [Kocuria varians]
MGDTAPGRTHHAVLPRTDDAATGPEHPATGPEGATPGDLRTAAAAVRSKKRVLAASFVGTTIEWYDFYLYGAAAALVFNHYFFPQGSGVGAVIASFATFAIAFFFRPLGGIVAGHLGDRIGRKALLVASLLAMGLATTLIGLLPGFDRIGWAAVVLLVACRILQGLSAGMEWGGSAVLSVEHAPAGMRGLFGSFTQVGSAAGMLLSTAFFAVVQAVTTAEQFQAWGWRVPFVFSAVLVVIGLVIRAGVSDADEFREVKAENHQALSPVREVLTRYPRGVIVCIGQRMVQPAIFSILTVYTLTYVTQHRGQSQWVIVSILIAAGVGIVGGPFWGWLSDRVGRRRISVVSAALIGVFVWPYFLFLDRGPLALLPLVYLLGLAVLHDSIYGPQAALFAEQFPVHLRYSGVSLGYQVGTILSGGLTPMIAAWLVATGGGTPWLLCGYLAVLAAVSVLTGRMARDSVADGARVVPTRLAAPVPA